jgi:hypothetical protein
VRRPPLPGPMNRIGARVRPRGVRSKKGVYPRSAPFVNLPPLAPRYRCCRLA